MSVLVALDTFTASGTGSAITTPSRFSRITVLYSLSGSFTNASMTLDALMSNGTWISSVLLLQNRQGQFAGGTMNGGTVGALVSPGDVLSVWSQKSTFPTGGGTFTTTPMFNSFDEFIIQGVRANVILTGSSPSLVVQVQAISESA